MSKVLPATCENQKVKIDDLEVIATILSQGKKPSSGIAVIDRDEVTYVTSNATDIKEVIEKVVELVNKVADVLTALGSGMHGPTTAPPPTLAVDVLDIQTKATALNTMKDNLK